MYHETKPQSHKGSKKPEMPSLSEQFSPIHGESNNGTR